MSSFEDLNEDVLLNIFSKLNPFELMKMKRVNSYFDNLIESNLKGATLIPHKSLKFEFNNLDSLLSSRLSKKLKLKEFEPFEQYQNDKYRGVEDMGVLFVDNERIDVRDGKIVVFVNGKIYEEGEDIFFHENIEIGIKFTSHNLHVVGQHPNRNIDGTKRFNFYLFNVNFDLDVLDGLYKVICKKMRYKYLFSLDDPEYYQDYILPATLASLTVGSIFSLQSVNELDMIKILQCKEGKLNGYNIFVNKTRIHNSQTYKNKVAISWYDFGTFVSGKTFIDDYYPTIESFQEKYLPIDIKDGVIDITKESIIDFAEKERKYTKEAYSKHKHLFGFTQNINGKMVLYDIFSLITGKSYEFLFEDNRYNVRTYPQVRDEVNTFDLNGYRIFYKCYEVVARRSVKEICDILDIAKITETGTLLFPSYFRKEARRI